MTSNLGYQKIQKNELISKLKSMWCSYLENVYVSNVFGVGFDVYYQEYWNWNWNWNYTFLMTFLVLKFNFFTNEYPNAHSSPS